jgi:hypothetical protein
MRPGIGKPSVTTILPATSMSPCEAVKMSLTLFAWPDAS